MALSMRGQRLPMADVEGQLELLRPKGRFVPFERKLAEGGLSPLTATGIEIFQMNLGRLCNQTCAHCHVDAGPDRREIMSRPTMQMCLEALEDSDISIVDVTGGAPEMNPDFCWLVDQLVASDHQVMGRCNLTILVAKGFEHLPLFMAQREVEIVASLPHFAASNADRQRGEGVFERSLEAMRKLNSLGYGQASTELVLNLVYNPVGPFLPTSQSELEAEYKTQLNRRYGIQFNSLFAITNMPINRYLDYLVRSGNYDTYMNKLINAYNPAAAEGAMCRNTLSVDWEGFLYDCDFNQMLGLRVDHGASFHIADFAADELGGRQIVTGLHCYGCTAGAGSSCAGAVAE